MKSFGPGLFFFQVFFYLSFLICFHFVCKTPISINEKCNRNSKPITNIDHNIDYNIYILDLIIVINILNYKNSLSFNAELIYILLDYSIYWIGQNYYILRDELFLIETLNLDLLVYILFVMFPSPLSYILIVILLTQINKHHPKMY